FPLPIEKQQVAEVHMIDFMQIYLHRNKQPLNTQGEREFIAALLDRFEMNATALNNYLNCPLRFYYQNLIRVPGGRSENSEFGSAVHHALEKFFTKAKEQDDVFPSVDVMVSDFEWYMYKHRESFTKEAYQRRIEYGNSVLRAYHDANIDEWKKHQIYSIERLFRNIVIEGVPVKGMIDKMIFDGRHVTIVDYKTGDPDKAKKKLLGPSEKDPNGGDYWRQGVFYKLMVEAYKLKDYQVTKTEFNFVEPDSSKKYVAPALTSVIPSPEELGIVRAQIKDTWHRIQQHEFYKGCGDEKCQWCNFVKEHKLYADLHEIDTDGPEENEL
ncbi:MAG TPA: PD-(D/E)XK nuclease family protein, partial [Chitinophagaceae bacterium]|nr:PD-(D/E)XK nuclease family protein [Chitinophagaceae bacterium]